MSDIRQQIVATIVTLTTEATKALESAVAAHTKFEAEAQNLQFQTAILNYLGAMNVTLMALVLQTSLKE